jgi:hypothetical protein
LSINNVINNWANYRCDAVFMPFAGLIMQSTLPPGTTQSEYTKQNFEYCTKNVMTNSMGEFLQPLEYSNQLASSNAINTTSSLNSARQNASNTRGSFHKLGSAISSIFTNASAQSKSIHAYSGSMSGKVRATGDAGVNSINTDITALNSRPSKIL